MRILPHIEVQLNRLSSFRRLSNYLGTGIEATLAAIRCEIIKTLFFVARNKLDWTATKLL